MKLTDTLKQETAELHQTADAVNNLIRVRRTSSSISHPGSGSAARMSREIVLAFLGGGK